MCVLIYNGFNDCDDDDDCLLQLMFIDAGGDGCLYHYQRKQDKKNVWK